MAKGKKKAAEPKGKKITLKMARNCLKMTVDGKRRLDLSCQGLAAVPKCLLKLCDVEELDLSRNLITKIPDFIGKFFNLRLLDLHSNYLEQVPEVIGRLQKLLTLNLCNNRLTSVPVELGLLKKLRQLNLGLNQLGSLPSSIAALEELRDIRLFDNRLTCRPVCLQGLRRLETVNLEGNPIPPEVAPDLDTIQRVESLYLVRESCLCGDCLERCQAERERLDVRGRGAGGSRVKEKTMFGGLVSPNSVALSDQETWRSKREEAREVT